MRTEDLPVCRGVILRLVVVSDATNDDRSDSPEHLQHLCCWGSQSHGHDFGAICRCVGNKDAPWNTFEDLRGEKCSLVIAKVEDEDGSVQKHETADGCPPIPDPRGDRACKEDTDQGAERSTALES